LDTRAKKRRETASEKEIIPGILSGRTRREKGRRKTSGAGNIASWTGLKPELLMRQMEERLLYDEDRLSTMRQPSGRRQLKPNTSRNLGREMGISLTVLIGFGTLYRIWAKVVIRGQGYRSGLICGY